MKLALSIAAIALMSAATANTANAFSFSPKSTHFAAKGSLMLTAAGTTVSCKADLTGATTATGKASIAGATFTGTSVVCSLITPTGLPWAMSATSATKAVIDNVAVSGGGSSCGPTNVPITVTSTGKFRFNHITLSGGCMVNGSLQTAPVIKITNP